MKKYKIFFYRKLKKTIIFYKKNILFITGSGRGKSTLAIVLKIYQLNIVHL